MFILITGAARSGKSRYAEQLAKDTGKDVYYIATAGVKDWEMLERIDKHKAQRPSHWITIEEELEVEKALLKIGAQDAVILIDCLTLWLSNLMDKYSETLEKEGFDAFRSLVNEKMQSLVKRIKEQPYDVILVTNEVGWGVVPGSKSGRNFRDLSGIASQIAAKAADKVYLLVAGLPLQIK